MPELNLSCGKRVLLDEGDMHLRSRKWHGINGGRYAQDAAGRLMHRVITEAARGVEVDHINGNGLDNRRCNLRLCVHADNSKNRKTSAHSKSGLKGVRFDPTRGNYCARITSGGKRRNLGRFQTAEAAHAAYCEAALRLHGEFARSA